MLTTEKVEALLKARRIQREIDACYPEARAMNAQHDLHRRDTGGFSDRRLSGGTMDPGCSCSFYPAEQIDGVTVHPARRHNPVCPTHAGDIVRVA